MRILVLGWYGHHNVGDESYKEIIPSLFPQHNFTFTDNLKSQIIEEFDAIVLGGGNVLRKGFVSELQKTKNIKIFGLSVGIEENPTDDLSFFSHVYARDEKTLNVLKSLNVPCTFLPDVALSLQGNAENGKKWLKEKFDSEKCELYSNIITVVVNSYMLNGALNGLARDAFSFIKFSYDFARVIDETPASFVFVPCGTQVPFDDRTTNAWVASKCKYWKKNYVVFDRLNYKETIDIIAASNLTISSRLHSSIFSYACGTPFIDLTHHSKNALFLNMIGKQHDSVNFWQFDGELLKEKINEKLGLPKHDECEKFRTMIRDTVNEIHFS